MTRLCRPNADRFEVPLALRSPALGEEWISVDGGLRLHLLRWDGDEGRTPFLLVHGLASNARLWAAVGAELAGRGHTCVAVDLRGHGRSAKPEHGYDTATAAADLAALLDRLDIGVARPVVAGQSWGGNVALELAARGVADLGGVVCVDGGWLEPARRFPAWDDCARELAPPPLTGIPAADIERRLQAAHPTWPDAAVAATLANFELREDGTVAPWLTRERHMLILRALWQGHPPSLYPDVDVPVLLLPVEHDGVHGEWTREEVAKAEALLAQSRTVWLAGDHDVHAQKPVEVADTLAGACRDGYFPR